MNYSKLINYLETVAKELERNGKKYSADQQGIISMKARAIQATVFSNAAQKKYSHNEDD